MKVTYNNSDILSTHRTKIIQFISFGLNFVTLIFYQSDFGVIFCFSLVQNQLKKVKLTFALFDDIFSRQIVAGMAIRSAWIEMESRHSKLPCKASKGVEAE